VKGENRSPIRKGYRAELDCSALVPVPAAVLVPVVPVPALLYVPNHCTPMCSIRISKHTMRNERASGVSIYLIFFMSKSTLYLLSCDSGLLRENEHYDMYGSMVTPYI
jgi:hypothetical protein